jgi:uncharacterized NAD-dependent epimerase/dehydratase family protein
MQLVEAIGGELQQEIRIDFNSAIRRGFDVVFALKRKLFVVSEVGVERQSTNTRRPDVEAYNVVVGRQVARRRSGSHFSL